MKKIMMTLLATLMLSASASAQDNAGQRPERKMDKAAMAKMQTERMTQELGLDEAQSAKLLELNTAYADKMRMGGPRGPRGGQRVDGQTGATRQTDAQPAERPSREQMEARMKEMQAQRAAYNEELKKILTEEQFAKYEAAEKQRMERRGGPRGGQRGGQRGPRQ